MTGIPERTGILKGKLGYQDEMKMKMKKIECHRFDTILYDTIRYDTIRYDTIRSTPLLLSVSVTTYYKSMNKLIISIMQFIAQFHTLQF